MLQWIRWAWNHIVSTRSGVSSQNLFQAEMMPFENMIEGADVPMGRPHTLEAFWIQNVIIHLGLLFDSWFDVPPIVLPSSHSGRMKTSWPVTTPSWLALRLISWAMPMMLSIMFPDRIMLAPVFPESLSIRFFCILAQCSMFPNYDGIQQDWSAKWCNWEWACVVWTNLIKLRSGHEISGIESPAFKLNDEHVYSAESPAPTVAVTPGSWGKYSFSPQHPDNQLGLIDDENNHDNDPWII